MLSLLQAITASAALWAIVQTATSDPRPSPTGAPQVSFLQHECRLESTSGAHWHRLWLNCGSGPHLISEPSSFMWHVSIENAQQALELVRLCSSLKACEQFPAARWLEITPAPKDDWLTLAERTYRSVCPIADSQEVVEAGAALTSVDT
jgi:hypothetical protein